MPRTFTARFDSDCKHCDGPISEGDEIAYIDDEIACETCVSEAEDD
jgi:alkyl hydroperoxide reductase subunit AhpF